MMHQQYDNKLSVGDLCLIIATSKPGNSFMIGKTIAVEGILEPGDSVPERYGEFMLPCKKALTVASCTAKLNSRTKMKDCFHLFLPKCLLPIRPMKDVDLSFDEIGELVVKVG